MYLGPIRTYCHIHCTCEETNAAQAFLHDVKTWSVRTALYNLWIRVRDPEWFRA